MSTERIALHIHLKTQKITSVGCAECGEIESLWSIGIAVMEEQYEHSSKK